LGRAIGGDRLEWFLIDGQVVDGEEFGFVEDHFLAAFADDIVEGGQFDGVDGACLFAHATEDAAEFVDFELGGVFFSVVPGGLGGLDMNAVGGADGGAHHAGDAFNSACGVFVETVDSTEVAVFDAALFDREMLAAFFGVLHGVAGSALAEGGEEVPEGGAEATEDGGKVDGFHGSHRLWGQINDLGVVDGHIRGSIAS